MALFRNQTESVDPGQINAANQAAGTPLVADGAGGARFDATGDIPPGAIILPEGEILIGDASDQADGVAVTGLVALSAAGVTSIPLDEGEILVGSASDVAEAVAVSGDVTITAAGVTAIGAKKVTAAMTAIADGLILIGDAAGAGAAKAVSGDITTTREGVVSIGASKVTNAMVQPGAAGAGLDGTVTKFVANANVIGGLLVIHQIDIADASADTDVILTHKTRIIDAWFVNSGIAAHAANDTLQLKNSADAITGIVAKTATVDAIRRFDILTAATRTIAAAGTLRVTAVKDTNAAATVFVLGIRVA